MIARADEAAAAVRAKAPLPARVAVVLGSGLGGFARSLERAVSIPYASIPHFRTVSVPGHRGDLVAGTSQGTPVFVFAGRPHLYEGYSADEVAFSVRLAARLGVRVLVVSNSSGIVNTNFKPGELMLITDHINLTGANPLTGLHDPSLGDRFLDMSDAYDTGLIEIAEKAARKNGVAVRKGVYLGLTGPSYETPAEVRMARVLGADSVGMSTVLEVIAARQMKMRVLGISCLSNYGTGIIKRKLDHAEVLQAGQLVDAALADLLTTVVAEAAKQVEASK
jgi:purine-nucleoside phosphorylase